MGLIMSSDLLHSARGQIKKHKYTGMAKLLIIKYKATKFYIDIPKIQKRFVLSNHLINFMQAQIMINNEIGFEPGKSQEKPSDLALSHMYINQEYIDHIISLQQKYRCFTKEYYKIITAYDKHAQKTIPATRIKSKVNLTKEEKERFKFPSDRKFGQSAYLPGKDPYRDDMTPEEIEKAHNGEYYVDNTPPTALQKEKRGKKWHI